MAKVTIEDISNLTGLSRGTVSRALNNRPDISAITKQKVLNACKELGYSPSHAARSLATGRCFAVAVVTDNLSNPLAIDYVRGVLAAAQASHYVVHVAELGTDVGTSLGALTPFVDERVDGVLFAAEIDTAFGDLIARFAKTRPLVGVGALGGLADEIGPDYAESGRLVANHVIGRAGDSFAYIYDSSRAHERLQANGVADACRAAGIDPPRALIDVGPPAPNRLDRGGGLLDTARGIAAGSDQLALEVILRNAAAGRIAGRDYAIAGQGCASRELLCSPRLTTTDYCGEEVGRRAFQMFMERLAKTRHDAPQQVFVTPRLLEGDTSRR